MPYILIADCLTDRCVILSPSNLSQHFSALSFILFPSLRFYFSHLTGSPLFAPLPTTAVSPPPYSYTPQKDLPLTVIPFLPLSPEPIAVRPLTPPHLCSPCAFAKPPLGKALPPSPGTGCVGGGGGWREDPWSVNACWPRPRFLNPVVHSQSPPYIGTSAVLGRAGRAFLHENFFCLFF